MYWYIFCFLYFRLGNWSRWYYSYQSTETINTWIVIKIFRILWKFRLYTFRHMSVIRQEMSEESFCRSINFTWSYETLHCTIAE